MKRMIFGVMVVAVVFTFIGCETSQGLGRDIQNLGAEVEDI